MIDALRRLSTFIMAGGEGKRLYPLTRDRTKPAVPFGGIYRFIDFTLSNCINSGLRRIHILTQYKSISLSHHLKVGWNIFHSELGERIDVIPAQQRVGRHWYRGTADAIYQNIYTIEKENPDYVLILAGDHIYKMNYHKMLLFHIEQKADVTVGVVEVPLEESRHFGVLEPDSTGRIIGFEEKPLIPNVPEGEGKVLASMGIYIFNTQVVYVELIRDATKDTSHDFGKDIIPSMLSHRKVMAYRFVDENRRQSPYWRA